MCLKHWRMVPKDLQRAVWRHYRRGQCDDKRPSQEWFAAADAAIQAVASKEAKRLSAESSKSVGTYDVAAPKKTAHQVAEQVLAGGMKPHAKALAAKYGIDYVTDWMKLHRAETRWAEDILARGDWAGLDTETTTRHADAEVIEVAIVRPDGTKWSWLIKPIGKITGSAMATHGITEADLASAPMMKAVHAEIQEALNIHKLILGWNWDFDKRLLNQSCFKAKLPLFKFPETDDVLLRFSKWAGVWNEKFNDYVWHILEGGHRAAGDVIKMIDIIKIMARATR